MLLSACWGDIFESDSGFTIRITNPADVSMMQTPDIVVNISGTVISEEDIEILTWQNDRGGKGAAKGKQTWETGNIVLQLGMKEITITAKDVTGRSISKSLTVEREDTTSTGNSGSNREPVVLYSYQSDLSHAAPVAGASVYPQQIFLFVVPSDVWTEQGVAHIMA